MVRLVSGGSEVLPHQLLDSTALIGGVLVDQNEDKCVDIILGPFILSLEDLDEDKLAINLPDDLAVSESILGYPTFECLGSLAAGKISVDAAKLLTAVRSAGLAVAERLGDLGDTRNGGFCRLENVVDVL